MPVTKLGQVSHNAISDLQQKHWDVDMKINEKLSMASLDVKEKIAIRLQGIIDEINTEIKQREDNLGM